MRDLVGAPMALLACAKDTLFFPPIPNGERAGAWILPWQRWGEGGGASFNRPSLEKRDHVILADNLRVLDALSPGSVDLVYIDPPFGTGKTRNSPRGDRGPEGFEDGIDDPEEFVSWLSPRLSGMWRALSYSGNLVIHLDPRAVHHVRLWCDGEFGSDRWENEIVWHYTGGGRSKSRFSRKHDVLLWYSKGPGRVFNIDAVREPYEPTSGYAKGGIVSRKGKKYMPHPEGKPADDVWDIPIINPLSSERTAYPTQKPLRLLERVINALSAGGAIVCDFFSGSGTTALACRLSGRRFLCCDSNPDAIGVTLDRLRAQDRDASQPALLSHGFYRLPYATAATAERLGSILADEAFGVGAERLDRIIFPCWREDENPPYPLERGDAVARFACE